MGKFQNVFLSGIIDKDNNRRLIASDALVDAENFVVVTTENSNRGVGRNVPGNIKLTNNLFTAPEDLGSKADSAKEKVYYFVKTTGFDYILEYNFVTNTNAVVLRSTTGTRLNFKTGERILNIDIIYSGEEYDPVTQQGGNLILWSGDSNPPRVGNIERMKTWGLDGFTAEEIMLIKAPPLFPPTINLTTTSSEAENFIKDKFLSFATRFKYKDGYYSAISSWQEYAFTPKVFNLDFNSKQNLGMQNSVNAVNIRFNTGPREVIAIDLLYKFSNGNTVYKVDQFIKSEQGWSDNVIIPSPILFDNSKTYQILSSEQYFRSFDNVPEQVFAQTSIGSRIAFANYLEGKNMIDENGDKVVMSYTVGFNSVGNTNYQPPVTQFASTSPFDGSSIPKGKIRLDFSTTVLGENYGLGIDFNLVTLPVSPPLTPTRPVDTFTGLFSFLIPQAYANIAALVADTSNEFKSGLEGYFSQTLRNQINLPPDSLPFPPDPPGAGPYSIFNGFQVVAISANVLEITLPTMKYEIVQTVPPNTFVNEYYTDNTTQAIVGSVGSKKSMKSYRSYEIAMIHRDAQGRKTTATVSEDNTIYIPIADSVNKNTITVDLHAQKPPAWATTYKFAIKENKRNYETIYVTQFFEDGYFRWVLLDGENINKVKENDILLLKRDVFDAATTPILVPVLELKNQEEDFLPGTGTEPAGLYMKINPAGFSMPIDPNSYREFNVSDSSRSTYPGVEIQIDGPIPNGTIFSITVTSNKGGTSSENNKFQITVTANSDYADFAAFYNAQIAPIPFQGDNTSVNNGGLYTKSLSGQKIIVIGTSTGSGSSINNHRGFVNMSITIRTSSGMLIFETLGEDVNDGIFYETPDVFPITNGDYVPGIHVLDKTFNCYVMGNGAESYQILDRFNAKYLSIDFSPTAVSENEYRQINRFADITYSEPYNTNTSINRLNEFNLSLANFKDDIEKSYGPIMKINGLDTNLEVFQEDKDSIVYYGKDLLFNADGTTNLTGIPQVLGQQQTYEGEFGISTHPESYARYGFNTYHTDVKRGVVIKKSNNGLFEISSQGMTNYFKKLFLKTQILNILGEYDQYNDLYVLNIKYIENSVTKYVTWLYSDRFNGWTMRHSFNPEDLCRLNSNFISFFQGEMYLHNQALNGSVPNYNIFYGVEYPSKFEFDFSQGPSERKIFSTLEIEGTTKLDIITETDQNKGYINNADFELKEGVFYAYIRNSNDTIDTSLLSCQGIGNATVSGLVLQFAFDLDPIVAVGDKIINLSKQIVGTIVSKTANTLTLDVMNNILSGDFVICAKIQSIGVNSMLGYYMNVKGTFSSTSEKEIFAINTEVVKSYM